MVGVPVELIYAMTETTGPTPIWLKSRTPSRHDQYIVETSNGTLSIRFVGRNTETGGIHSFITAEDAFKVHERYVNTIRVRAEELASGRGDKSQIDSLGRIHHDEVAVISDPETSGDDERPSSPIPPSAFPTVAENAYVVDLLGLCQAACYAMAVSSSRLVMMSLVGQPNQTADVRISIQHRTEHEPTEEQGWVHVVHLPANVAPLPPASQILGRVALQLITMMTELNRSAGSYDALSDNPVISQVMSATDTMIGELKAAMTKIEAVEQMRREAQSSTSSEATRGPVIVTPAEIADLSEDEGPDLG